MGNKVVLSCSKCHHRNYTTTKSAIDAEQRLEIRKFCKRCDAHTEHRETK
jgi:large subunit ribosomal protein L33